MRLLRNMGRADRALRFVAASGIAALIATRTVEGGAALALGALGTAMLFSGSTGHCPLYVPLGLSTCERPASGAD